MVLDESRYLGPECSIGARGPAGLSSLRGSSRHAAPVRAGPQHQLQMPRLRSETRLENQRLQKLALDTAHQPI